MGREHTRRTIAQGRARARPPQYKRGYRKNYAKFSPRNKVGFKTSSLKEESPSSDKKLDGSDEEDRVEEYMAIRQMKNNHNNGPNASDYYS